MAASPQFPKLPTDWSEESHFLNGDELHLRIYKNKNLSRGRLLYLIHGQAEQSDRYEHFPHYLNGIVDAIACIDLPGHGKSKGIRGHIENFDEYTQAALTGFRFAEAWMKKESEKSVCHWFGHSMGGLITIRALLAEPQLNLKSVTTSAPLLGLSLPVPPVKKFFAELTEPLLGRVKLGNELDGSLISHDPEVAKAYDQNPLNHNYVTPRFFVHLMKEMPKAQGNRGPFHYNFMMLIPLGDLIVSWKAAWNFYQNLEMKEGFKKELTTFPQFYHESFNEIGKERAFNALSDWLKKHS